MPSFHHNYFDAIALDFDGTLADTERAHTDARLLAYQQLAVELERPELAAIDPAIHAEAHHHGSDPLSINMWVLMKAGILRNRDSKKIPTAIVKRKTENYHEMSLKGLEPMPGALEFVALAHQIWGEKIFIVTTAHRDEEVIPFLGRHGLTQTFKDTERQLITRESLQNPKNLKPSPEAYMILLKMLGLEATPERLLAIEDTPNGIESARGAGAIAVGILTPSCREAMLDAEDYRRADFFAEGFDDLAAIIDTR